MNNIWILAQTETEETPSRVTSEQVTEQDQTGTLTQSDPNAVGAQRPASKPIIPFWVLLVFMLVMVFMLFRGPQKQKQKRKQLDQSLAKNDRIQTIGGIIGTIVDIKDNEITLKIDESNNTKIKIFRSAIGKNLSKDKG